MTDAVSSITSAGYSPPAAVREDAVRESVDAAHRLGGPVPEAAEHVEIERDREVGVAGGHLPQGLHGAAVREVEVMDGGERRPRLMPPRRVPALP